METDPSSQPLKSESHEWIEGDSKHTGHTCMMTQYVCLRESKFACDLIDGIGWQVTLKTTPQKKNRIGTAKIVSF